jgi:hypothetical protein
MSDAFVVKLEGGLMVAPWPGNPVPKIEGGRLYVWTKSLEKAEMFASAPDADEWARRHLPHLLFEVAAVVGVTPGPGDGGQPAVCSAQQERIAA